MHITIRGEYESREVYLDDCLLDPAKSQKLNNHSPDGFNWGYAGSGPAQLALAVLLERSKPATALRLHQAFKDEYIATLPAGQSFSISVDVDGWIQKELIKEEIY